MYRGGPYPSNCWSTPIHDSTEKSSYVFNLNNIEFNPAAIDWTGDNALRSIYILRNSSSETGVFAGATNSIILEIYEGQIPIVPKYDLKTEFYNNRTPKKPNIYKNRTPDDN